MATSFLGRLHSKLRRDARISVERTLLYRRARDREATTTSALPDGMTISLLSAHEVTQLGMLGPFDVEDAAGRLERGDRCYGTRINGALVHYSWVQHLGVHAITSAGVEVEIREGDLWIYNCRTSQTHRGRGIYPRTLEWITANAFQQGARCAWIYAADSNIASQRGIQRASFERVSTLLALRLGPFVRPLERAIATRALAPDAHARTALGDDKP